MPSASKNQMSGVVVPTLVTKLTRGFPAKLGVIAAAGDVVAFATPEPGYMPSSYVLIQVQNTGTLVIGAGTFALEASIDGGLSWFTLPTAAVPGAGNQQSEAILYSITGQPGADTAAVMAARYLIGGFGSGAQFRFGFVVAPTSGSCTVWALQG